MKGEQSGKGATSSLPLPQSHRDMRGRRERERRGERDRPRTGERKGAAFTDLIKIQYSNSKSVSTTPYLGGKETDGGRAGEEVG